MRFVRVVVGHDPDVENPVSYSGFELHLWGPHYGGPRGRALRHFTGWFSYPESDYVRASDSWGDITPTLGALRRVECGTGAFVRIGDGSCVETMRRPNGFLVYTGKPSDIPIPREPVIAGLVAALNLWCAGDCWCYRTTIEEAGPGRPRTIDRDSLGGLIGEDDLASAIRDELYFDDVIVHVAADSSAYVPRAVERLIHPDALRLVHTSPAMD